MSIVKIIQQAMSLSSDDRFETVGEFWQQLQARASQQRRQELEIPSRLIPQPLLMQSHGRIPAAVVQSRRPAPGLRKHPVLLLALLALLLTAALATGFLLHAESAPAAAQRIAPLSRPTVKSSATLTPDASIYPSLAASYAGTVSDLMTQEKTDLFLTDIQHNQVGIHGSFRGLGLVGLFTGTVTPSGQVQFTVKIYGGEMALAFEGNIKIGGDMAGSFTVLNQHGQHTGEAGLWNVASSP